MPAHKILNIASDDKSLSDPLCAELGISPLIARLFVNRGITTPAEAHRFMNPEITDLLDPFSFSGMRSAVERIARAREQGEKVLVHGDYDADGITSLALLTTNLKRAGLQVIPHLPHRVKEGYGLSKVVVQRCREEGATLVITADCGISNHAIVEELKRAAVDTIITDHHEPSGGPLPSALAVINPKVDGCGYGFRELAGVGVAFKLCQAVAGESLAEELDLVSIGTIADSVPLRGENRIIAKEGLARLADTRRVGLRTLMDKSGIKRMNTTAVSFIIAPRINAGGRVDSGEVSLKLLMSESESEAKELVKQVEDYNRQRQKIENKILEEAEDIIAREVNFKEHKVIVIAKEDWHHGVLGIVASKLADRFYRPAIVISVNEGSCKGSARSIKNFHLFRALKDCERFLDSFGGHSHAAGLVITRDSIGEFRDMINRLAHDRLKLEDLLPSIDVDAELTLADVGDELIAGLGRMEPFGMGNPEPLFLTRSLKLKGIPQTVSRGTLKFWVTDGMFTYQAIGFGMAGLKDSLAQSQSFDMIYAPRIDTWWGMQNIILEAKDLFLR